MCCEFTAQCSFLSSDWLGVLKALCCSAMSCGYSELLNELNVKSYTVIVSYFGPFAFLRGSISTSSEYIYMALGIASHKSDFTHNLF